jgi:hypothetical protein
MATIRITRPIIDGSKRKVSCEKYDARAAAELSAPLTSHVVPSNREEQLHEFMPFKFLEGAYITTSTAC